jgi:hypothetical protein
MDHLVNNVDLMWIVLKPIHNHCMSLCTRRCHISLTTITICYAQFLLDCKLACFHSTTLNSYKCKQNKMSPKVKHLDNKRNSLYIICKRNYYMGHECKNVPLSNAPLSNAKMLEANYLLNL